MFTVEVYWSRSLSLIPFLLEDIRETPTQCAQKSSFFIILADHDRSLDTNAATVIIIYLLSSWF